jgi:hypothetical protein
MAHIYNISPLPILVMQEYISIPASIKTREQLKIYIKQLYGSNMIEIDALLKYMRCYHALWQRIYPTEPYMPHAEVVKELKILGQQCHILKNDYKEIFT